MSFVPPCPPLPPELIREEVIRKLKVMQKLADEPETLRLLQNCEKKQLLAWWTFCEEFEKVKEENDKGQAGCDFFLGGILGLSLTAEKLHLEEQTRINSRITAVEYYQAEFNLDA